MRSFTGDSIFLGGIYGNPGHAKPLWWCIAANAALWQENEFLQEENPPLQKTLTGRLEIRLPARPARTKGIAPFAPTTLPFL